MALQATGSSFDTIQTVKMGTSTHEPQNNVSMAHVSGYGIIDCTTIGSSLGLPVVPGNGETVANTQGIVSGQSSTNAIAVMKQVSHVVLRPPLEEQGQREQERRIRREIANSNERRRMQSINAGFKSLKSILPHTDGEKLSKAAILQQTSEYITQLESEKLKLMNQNEKLRRSFAECKCAPMKRRALSDIFEKDEGIGSPAEEDFDDVRRGLVEVRQLLDKERRLRISYEDQIRNFEKQVCPERLKSMERSNERQYSLEGSPCQSKAKSNVQSCARLLLPPLAPLLSKQDKSDLDILPLQDKLIPLSKMRSTHCNVGQSATLSTSIIATHGKMDYAAANTKCYQGSSDSMVTVFSHSTKSNQPLKKRAVEFHQQNSSDSGNSSIPSQCQKKIAADQPGRSHLPCTLSVKSEETNGTKCTGLLQSLSGTVVPTSQLLGHNLLLSHHVPQQLQGSQYTPESSALESPNRDTSAESTMIMAPGHGFTITSSNIDVSARDDQDVYALIESMPLPENSRSSHQLHVTLGAQRDADIPYERKNSDKLVPACQRLSHPSYVMTSLSSPGAVLLSMPPRQNFLGDSRRQVGLPLLTEQTGQLTSVGENATLPVAMYQSESSQSSKKLTAVARHNLLPVNRVPVQQESLPTQNMSRFHTSQPQNTRPVLCYAQPELTLNQLNAVPNLAPPKSLHQPSPQESVLQKPSIFVNSTALLRRKSSISVTDSCGTASSAEDDDRTMPKNSLLEEPNGFLGRSSPPIKLPGAEAMDTEQQVLPARRGINVAAFDEISRSSSPEKIRPPDGIDITEPITSAISDGAVPVLSNLVGSPVVMRQIDAIQTRRNLETIVQAIDHLEQQERRNSQDHSDHSALE